MKAFLGTGLLGHGFVRAMISKGETVQVWNRTASKAKDLEQYGAKALEDIAAAVSNAEIVHLALKDDATVDVALSEAEPGLAKGTIIVDHTTTSVEGAKKRTAEWQSKGFLYQHAPVFMGPQNALESTGFMLVSGDQRLVKKLEPQLSALTGKLINLGEEPGKAAAMKLTGNLFLVAFTGAIADMISFAHASGISVSELLQLFSEWNPASALPARLKRMTADDFSNPSWRLDMARKDTGLFMQEAASKNIPLTVIPPVADLMDKWIKKGHGPDDWSIIGKIE
ncbi:NAD(P)-dependent oxidoreductase [Ginsengibacter hankyongi]|uniref:NAD(P)-dependent oxidoreductase n=1 Tax=Ginsengibacter hankyongi TaxID=2607284 RepID=A0A5J5IAD9_9BACT|nr:NAD(P)-dependent oxidoreductase [Ginsengibacter hankyongi]KAA9035481.1 NAD(P)-dependent oxidoreductase [Ginsengibacter hankyongi]